MNGPSSEESAAAPVVGRPGGSQDMPLLVTLAPELAAQAETMTADAGHLLSHAANIFGLLRDSIEAGGMAVDDPGLASLTEVYEHAFRDMAMKEGTVLDEVGDAIRAALGARARGSRPEGS